MSFSGIKLFKLIKQFKGIGTPVSKKICLLLGYDFRLKSSFLKKKDLEKIDLLVRERVIVDKSLNFLIKKNIIKSQRIKSYKGKRHAQGLPVRGQRTHSNGLTAKRLSFYKISKNEIKTKTRKKNDKSK